MLRHKLLFLVNRRWNILGHRIKQANLKAKKRFKKWYPEWDSQFYKRHFGLLRKTNVRCSCQMCRNPRHSTFYNEENKKTIQERKAPTVEEFDC